MEDITKEIRADVIINRVNLLNSAVNEATNLKNLLDEQIACRDCFGLIKSLKN